MRRMALGISIAVGVLCASSLVSYAILNHFYGREYFATSTQMMVIENFGQQVTIGEAKYDVENAEYLTEADNYRLYLEYSGDNYPDNNELGFQPLAQFGAPYNMSISRGTVDVSGTAYNQALQTGGSVTIYDTKTRETEPINAMPIAASIGIVMSFVVFGVWVGYRRMWGDATSTLLEHGLQDMTVRDVEIVGQIMDLKEFTIPQLVKETRASKLKVWRTVQKLVEQGLVQQTDQTKSAANGMGGRGKPSNVYKYVGKPKTE